jgi:hypothetical protein
MVGGIEKSIRSFTLEFRKLGYEVVMLNPECELRLMKRPGVKNMPRLVSKIVTGTL